MKKIALLLSLGITSSILVTGCNSGSDISNTSGAPLNNIFNSVETLSSEKVNDGSKLNLYICNKEMQEIYLGLYQNHKPKQGVILSAVDCAEVSINAKEMDIITFHVAPDPNMELYSLNYEETNYPIKIFKSRENAVVRLDISNSMASKLLEGTCQVLSPIKSASCI